MNFKNIILQEQITKEDITYYTSEGCAYFAIALHELFKYEIAILYDEKSNYNKFFKTLAHVFTLKNNVAIDVTGKQHLNKIISKYHDLIAPNIMHVTKQELISTYMGNSDRKPLYAYDKQEIIIAKKIITEHKELFI